MSNALELAIRRNNDNKNVVVTTIYGETRELLDQLETGDEFVWPNDVRIDHALTKGDAPTAAPGSDEYQNQLANYKPVYFVLVEITKNEQDSSRVGKICKLYLKSLNKRVFEYTKDENERIVTTKRYITSDGNVCELTQKLSTFAEVHNALKGKTIKVQAIQEIVTKKFKRKDDPAPDELTLGHVFTLTCDSL